MTSRPGAADRVWLAGEGLAPVLLERMSLLDVAAFCRPLHDALRDAASARPSRCRAAPTSYPSTSGRCCANSTVAGTRAGWRAAPLLRAITSGEFLARLLVNRLPDHRRGSGPRPIDAGHRLHDDLYVHLHEADYLAEQDDEWSADDTESARKLIGDLVLVIRGLLIEHRPQSSGDCQTCPSAWPCPVVTTIHAFVKDPQRQFAALVLRARDDR